MNLLTRPLSIPLHWRPMHGHRPPFDSPWSASPYDGSWRPWPLFLALKSLDPSLFCCNTARTGPPGPIVVATQPTTTTHPPPPLSSRSHPQTLFSLFVWGSQGWGINPPFRVCFLDRVRGFGPLCSFSLFFWFHLGANATTTRFLIPSS